MRNLALFFMITLFPVSCSVQEDDYSQKAEQELWLNGYTQSISKGKVTSAAIRFLFFSADNNEEFDVKGYSSDVSSFYEYTLLEEDEIYSRLLEKGELKLKSGEVVKPVGDFVSSILKNDQLEVNLPIGKYFVIAFYNGRTLEYWNRYATTYYMLESRYNPQSLTVIIPGDYSKCGAISWFKWSDGPLEF